MSLGILFNPQSPGLGVGRLSNTASPAVIGSAHLLELPLSRKLGLTCW